MPAITFSLTSTTHLTRRTLTTGAKAGLGVGVAAASLLLLALLAFVIYHFRRQRHLAAIEQARAQLAGEKKTEEQRPAMKRNKSIKDRLKGPLYQEPFEMPPTGGAKPGEGRNWTDVDGQPLTHKPWMESSPRPSFSSKRGTRMMMMM
jgi:hypothetical protein